MASDDEDTLKVKKKSSGLPWRAGSQEKSTGPTITELPPDEEEDSEEIKKRNLMAKKVVEELTQTEKSYVSSLKLIDEVKIKRDTIFLLIVSVFCSFRFSGNLSPTVFKISRCSFLHSTHN